MVTVRTYPQGYTLEAICFAAREDAPGRLRRRVNEHVGDVIKECDGVLLRQAAIVEGATDRQRLHCMCMSAYSSMFGWIGWLIVRAAVSWIVWWYLDLAFSDSRYMPGSMHREGKR